MRCIYRIDINDRYYIGSTNDFDNRVRLHLVKLHGNTHPNKFLQNLYNKYGKDTFKFSVVEQIDENVDTLEAEQPYLNEHFGQENCVNLSPIAGGGFYYKRTPEIIQKQLDTRKANGNWCVPRRTPIEAIKANTGSKRNSKFRLKSKEYLLVARENHPETFLNAAKKGRENRWKKHKTPFILYKDGVEFGRYDHQMDVSNIGIMSQVSINQLFLGKKSSVKGFTIKLLSEDTK